ncbi:hypothetical protein GCM10011316_04330 [Roseibium aquae]|uniref:Uncharacterized protein n=1 Tax=Roseibium aquae TaxID=1323746 RepID=A0A916WWI0_9HYPH|nr:hypothetical protein [Roseibium aquae]GGB35347.1 hypothetical protein GCM10011316_04330 [Roseibium aquae]
MTSQTPEKSLAAPFVLGAPGGKPHSQTRTRVARARLPFPVGNTQTVERILRNPADGKKRRGRTIESGTTALKGEGAEGAAMSDIGGIFTGWDLLILFSILASPGLVAGAAVGAIACRNRRAGAMIGAPAGFLAGLACVTVYLVWLK